MVSPFCLSPIVGFVLLCLSSASVRTAALAPDRPGEVRALWATRASLASPRSIADLVTAAKTYHFNTLLVQVRARGDAYFADGVEPRAAALKDQAATFDPLAVTLALARAAGLRVHAWVNVALVSSAVDVPVDPSHIVRRHPEWLMVPKVLANEMCLLDAQSGLYVDKLARWTRSNDASGVEGLYLSPIPAGAADYTALVISDLVSRYAVDGVHLDYARYPSQQFDYSREALAAFAESVRPELSAEERQRLDRRLARDVLAYVDTYPERWRAFRRARLTALIARLRETVRGWLPEATVTAAVHPDSDEAALERLQDWRVWLERGWIDAACPMAYATDTLTFTAQMTSALAGAAGRPIWAGIGAFRLPSQQAIENIQIARRLGAAGVAIFSYDSLIAAGNGGDYLAQLGQGAFSR